MLSSQHPQGIMGFCWGPWKGLGRGQRGVYWGWTVSRGPGWLGPWAVGSPRASAPHNRHLNPVWAGNCESGSSLCPACPTFPSDRVKNTIIHTATLTPFPLSPEMANDVGWYKSLGTDLSFSLVSILVYDTSHSWFMVFFSPYGGRPHPVVSGVTMLFAL